MCCQIKENLKKKKFKNESAKSEGAVKENKRAQ